MHKIFLPVVAVILAIAPASSAQQLGWLTYVDPTYGFSAQLPLDVFEEVETDSPGIALAEIGGAAKLNVSGGPAEGMTREALEARLAAGEQISTITYRAGGESWFVLSGYYKPEAGRDQVIFYTKVLFSPDRRSFSAFEISFPARDKPRFEALVERFEDNFTRPRG